MIFELSLDAMLNRSRSPECIEPRRSKSVCSPRLTVSSTNSLNEPDVERLNTPSPVNSSRNSLVDSQAQEIKKHFSSAPHLDKRPLTSTLSVPRNSPNSMKTQPANKNNLTPGKIPLAARKSLGVEVEFKLFSSDSLAPIQNQIRKLSLR
ncbi:unnamed protein product, partial [Mesorhabditis belari]|uniref:Uncharacterized protein n=1 Tax=Mesorhabditis belari TaxID=2138241 RepID=A0AAF3JBL6_9BILA